MTDIPKSLEAFDRACNLGHPRSCYRVGTLYEGGYGTPALAGLAGQYYSRACDSAVGVACEALARWLALRNTPSAETALLLAKACDLGVGPACGALGQRYRSGTGVEHDETRAGQLLERGCELGSGAACEDLARLLVTSKDLPDAAARAAVLFERACDAGRLSSCASVASRSPASEATGRALTLLDQGCRSEPPDSSACFDLAGLYQDGRGVAVDLARAATLFERACRAGTPTGPFDGACCSARALRQQIGLDPAPDPAARRRDDRVRAIAIRHAVKGPRLGALLHYPCPEAPSPFLLQDLRRRFVEVGDDSLGILWLGPVRWEGSGRASVHLGDPSPSGQGGYVVARDWLGRWRVVDVLLVE